VSPLHTKYFVFRDGVMTEHVYPRWLFPTRRLQKWATRSLFARKLPPNEVGLLLGAVDLGHLLKVCFVAATRNVVLFQAEFPSFAWPCSRAARLFGGRSLLVQHNIEYRRVADMYPDLDPAAMAWLRQMELDACRRVDGVITVSEPDRTMLTEAGVDPRRIRTIPHGVNLAEYDATEAIDLRARLGLSPDTILLIYHGTYNYAPNEEAVLYAAEHVLPRLRQHGYDVRLVAVGAHPPLTAAPRDVIFTGPVDKLAPYIKAADIACVPLQKGGGTRMKILEYFAAGIPLVCTRKAIEGIPCDHDRAAAVYDDPEEMTRAIIDLLGDRDRRNQMVRYAKDFVNTLDWSEIARRYLQFMNIEPVRKNTA
jgi:glycosyltransferase involved in cell wall biosynthesis